MRSWSPVIIIVLLLLFPHGCRKRSAHLNHPSKKIQKETSPEIVPPAITPSVTDIPKKAPIESAPLPETITTPSSFELAEMEFKIGNYQQAAKSYEEFLSTNRESQDRPTALFHLGLARAFVSKSSEDMRQAEEHLRRLITEFPKTQYRKHAEFILGLLDQIDKLKSEVKEKDEKVKKLSEELKVLKEIDLSRRPSRPPE